MIQHVSKNVRNKTGGERNKSNNNNKKCSAKHQPNIHWAHGKEISVQTCCRKLCGDRHGQARDGRHSEFIAPWRKSFELFPFRGNCFFLLGPSTSNYYPLEPGAWVHFWNVRDAFYVVNINNFFFVLIYVLLWLQILFITKTKNKTNLFCFLLHEIRYFIQLEHH